MKKRLLSMLLVLTMVFSLVPAMSITAAAEESPAISVGSASGTLNEGKVGTVSYAVTAQNFTEAPETYTVTWVNQNNDVVDAPAGVTVTTNTASCVEITTTADNSQGDYYFYLSALNDEESVYSEKVSLYIDYMTAETWADGLRDPNSDIPVEFTNVVGVGALTTGNYTVGSTTLEDALVMTTKDGEDNAYLAMDGTTKVGDMLATLSGYNFGGDMSYVEVEGVALGTELVFNYAFASCEFNQNAQYNDSFALLVSVQNDQGNWSEYKNIAIIPGTVPEEAVNIQNLKDDGNGEGRYWHEGAALSEGLLGYQSYGQLGYTPVFQAKASNLIRGNKFRMLFAICDITDSAYDSAVIIEKGSFSFSSAATNYQEENVVVLKTNTEYTITFEDNSTVDVISDSDGKIPFEWTENQTTYSLLNKTIQVKEKGSSKAPATLTIAPRPGTPAAPGAPATVGKPEAVTADQIECDTDKIKVVSPVAGQEYSVDNGETWQKYTGTETIEFTGLTPNTEYHVITRIAATDKAPRSLPSPESATVKTQPMLKNQTVTLTEYNGSYDGQPHGISVSVSGVSDVTVEYSTEEATNYSSHNPTFTDVGEYTVYYRMTKEGYYTAYGSGKVTINKAALTVSGTAVSDKYYDGNTTATVEKGNVEGLVEGDNVTVSASGTFASAAVGTHDVTVTYTLSGDDVGNYNAPDDETLSATISAADITDVTVTGYNSSYDGSEHTITVSDPNAETDTILYSTDGETYSLTEAPKYTAAGTYTVYVKVSRTGHTDYYSSASVIIAKKELTVSGTTVDGKTYDGTTSATVTAGTLEGAGENDSVFIDTAIGSFENKNAGTGKKVTVSYTLTGADAANYTVKNSEHSADITRAVLTVSGTKVESSKTYDGTKAATVTENGTLQDIQSNEYGTLDDVSIDTATGTFDNKNVGEDKPVTVTYTLTGADADNYTIENSECEAEITAKTITVTPDADQSKTYGAADPTLTYSSEGAITGETAKFTGTLSRESGEDIGNTYAITVGDLALADNDTFLASNYELKLSEPPVYFTITENPCKYTDSLTAGEYMIFLGSKEAGTFTITGDSCKGFQIKNGDEYVALVDGAVVTDSTSAFTWKYDGGLYMETKTTCKTGFWFWCKPTTKVTKQYLSFDGEKLVLSSCKVCAEVQVTAKEHTWAYLHDGDGKHEAYCTKCGKHETPKEHKYDETTHLCVCGKLNPDLCYVSDVKVTEKKTTSCRGFFFWKKTTTKYQYTICPETQNVCVAKVEYSGDGEKWSTGTVFSSDIKLREFYIRITDSNGKATNWAYKDGNVSNVNR